MPTPEEFMEASYLGLKFHYNKRSLQEVWKQIGEFSSNRVLRTRWHLEMSANSKKYRVSTKIVKCHGTEDTNNTTHILGQAMS